MKSTDRVKIGVEGQPYSVYGATKKDSFLNGKNLFHVMIELVQIGRFYSK